MTRRPLLTPVEQLAKAQSRMAPGGLLWSESPIPRRYSPRVPMAGEDSPDICWDLVLISPGVWRPAGGATFGAPVGAYYWVTVTPTVTVPGNFGIIFLKAAGANTRTHTQAGGPFPAGTPVSTAKLSETFPWQAAQWEEIKLWVPAGSATPLAASAVRYCYTMTPP